MSYPNLRYSSIKSREFTVAAIKASRSMQMQFLQLPIEEQNEASRLGGLTFAYITQNFVIFISFSSVRFEVIFVCNNNEDMACIA